MPAPNDPLDHLLDRWVDTPAPAEHLAAEVWRRISTAGEPEKTGWLARINEAFARPSFAVAFVAACMLFGLFLAEIRLSRLQVDYNTRLMQSYLRLIDPLLKTASSSSARTPGSQS